MHKTGTVRLGRPDPRRNKNCLSEQRDDLGENRVQRFAEQMVIIGQQRDGDMPLYPSDETKNIMEWRHRCLSRRNPFRPTERIIEPSSELLKIGLSRIRTAVRLFQKIRLPDRCSDRISRFPRQIGKNRDPDIDMIRAEHIVHIE